MFTVILLCYLTLVSTVTAAQPPRYVRRNSTPEVTPSSICSGSRANASHRNSSATHSRNSTSTFKYVTGRPTRSTPLILSGKNGTATKTALRCRSSKYYPHASSGQSRGSLSSHTGTQPPYPYRTGNIASAVAPSGPKGSPIRTASGHFATGFLSTYTGTRPPYPTENTKSSSIQGSSGTQVPSITSSYGLASIPPSLNASSNVHPSGLTNSSITASVTATLTATRLPSNDSAVSSAVPAASSSNPIPPKLSGCGAVSVYYYQTQQDWVNNNMDVWLDQWVSKHVAEIAANNYGFTGAFASYAIGNPDFSCRDDGSSSDCDFNPCDIATLNNLGTEIRPAYYVMESVNRFHAYFMAMREGFTVSAIASALSKDDWATTFYIDKDVKQVQALREVLTASQAIIGIGAAMASLAGPVGREASPPD